MKKIIIILIILLNIILIKSKPLLFKTIYSYNYNNNKINFYKNNNLINSYECKDDCYINSINTITYFDLKNKLTTIKDGNKLYLYNYENGQILQTKENMKTNYNNIYPLNNYFLVKEKDSIKVKDYMENTLKTIEINNDEIMSVFSNKNNINIKTNKNEFNIKIKN